MKKYFYFLFIFMFTFLSSYSFESKSNEGIKNEEQLFRELMSGLMKDFNFFRKHRSDRNYYFSLINSNKRKKEKDLIASGDFDFENLLYTYQEGSKRYEIQIYILSELKTMGIEVNPRLTDMELKKLLDETNGKKLNYHQHFANLFCNNMKPTEDLTFQKFEELIRNGKVEGFRRFLKYFEGFLNCNGENIFDYIAPHRIAQSFRMASLYMILSDPRYIPAFYNHLFDYLITVYPTHVPEIIDFLIYQIKHLNPSFMDGETSTSREEQLFSMINNSEILHKYFPFADFLKFLEKFHHFVPDTNKIINEGWFGFNNLSNNEKIGFLEKISDSKERAKIMLSLNIDPSSYSISPYELSFVADLFKKNKKEPSWNWLFTFYNNGVKSPLPIRHLFGWALFDGSQLDEPIPLTLGERLNYFINDNELIDMTGMRRKVNSTFFNAAIEKKIPKFLLLDFHEFLDQEGIYSNMSNKLRIERWENVLTEMPDWVFLGSSEYEPPTSIEEKKVRLQEIFSENSNENEEVKKVLFSDFPWLR